MDIFGHRRFIKRELYPGLMHFFIFWGFLFLFAATSIGMLEFQFHKLNPFDFDFPTARFRVQEDFGLGRVRGHFRLHRRVDGDHPALLYAAAPAEHVRRGPRIPRVPDGPGANRLHRGRHTDRRHAAQWHAGRASVGCARRVRVLLDVPGRFRRRDEDHVPSCLLGARCRNRGGVRVHGHQLHEGEPHFLRAIERVSCAPHAATERCARWATSCPWIDLAQAT